MTMAPFTISIAGCRIRVFPLFESTRWYCEHYLTEQPGEYTITVTREDLLREQQLLREEALQEGLRPRVFQDPFLERSVIQRQTAQLLFPRDILLLHGSTLSLDGSAYLFTAPCGTGKSTHTRLWREVYGSKVQMINDDKPFLRFTPEDIFAWGSPWSGKHGLDTNLCAPLKGICFLQRGTENRIVPILPEEGLPLLENQLCPPEDPALLPRYRALLNRLSHDVPLWRMTCTKDSEAARVAATAITKASPQEER